MTIQQRLLSFITISNWVLCISMSVVGFTTFSTHFALGILSGGLLVTINFHLLKLTLNKALTPPHLSAYQVVIMKYYIRFIVSGIIIFFLISKNYVDPLGLFIGLSVVVASIILATLIECKHIIFKEAM